MMHDGELMHGFGSNMFWPLVIELGVLALVVIGIFYFVRKAMNKR